MTFNLKVGPAMQYIDDAIVNLINASGGLVFTGYITGARLHRNWALEGEVWQHQRASPSGLFADGHRIQTSNLDEVHIAGGCVWVVTENQSRYGVLSFSPTGWRWLSELIRNGDDRPFCPLLVDHDADGAAVQPTSDGEALTWRPTSQLKPKLDETPKKGNTTRNPFRPPPQTAQLKQAQDHFDKSIAALRRHGMASPHFGDKRQPSDCAVEGTASTSVSDLPDPL